jgi:hypothetical protein
MRHEAAHPVDEEEEAAAGAEFDTAWVVGEGSVRLWKPATAGRVAAGVGLVAGGLIIAALFARIGGAQEAFGPLSGTMRRGLGLFFGAASVVYGLLLLRREGVVSIDPYVVVGVCPGRSRKRRTRWWREDLFAAEVRDDPAGGYQLVLVHARGGRWVLVTGSDREPLDQLCATIREMMALKRGRGNDA